MLDFKGKVGPLATATENALPPIAGHLLRFAQISLSAVNRFASGTLPADTDSTASGEADPSTLADILSCKGDLKLENTILNGAKLDYPIAATYNLEDDFKQKKMFIRAGALQLGPTSFTASGSVDTAPTPAILNVELKTDNSSITNWLS